MPAARSRSSPPPASGFGSRRADDDARDAAAIDGVDARRRSAVMGARLERDVERRAAGALARRLERDDLGVRAARPLVPALADDLAVARRRRRRRPGSGARRAAAALGELERALETSSRECLYQPPHLLSPVLQSEFTSNCLFNAGDIRPRVPE